MSAIRKGICISNKKSTIKMVDEYVAKGYAKDRSEMYEKMATQFDQLERAKTSIVYSQNSVISHIEP